MQSLSVATAALDAAKQKAADAKASAAVAQEFFSAALDAAKQKAADAKTSAAVAQEFFSAAQEALASAEVKDAMQVVAEAERLVEKEKYFYQQVASQLPSDDWVSFNFFGEPVRRILNFLKRDEEIHVCWHYECDFMFLERGNGYALRGKSLNGNQVIGWLPKLPD